MASGVGEMADESQRGYKERNWLAQGWVPEWSALGQFLKRMGIQNPIPQELSKQ